MHSYEIYENKHKIIEYNSTNTIVQGAIEITPIFRKSTVGFLKCGSCFCRTRLISATPFITEIDNIVLKVLYSFPAFGYYD